VAKKTALTFHFDSPDVMEHFWGWLCGSGEQSYWEWMKDREQEEDGDITVLDFDYASASKGLITTTSGRFTGDALFSDADVDEVTDE
jgi:hypothetical protein